MRCACLKGSEYRVKLMDSLTCAVILMQHIRYLAFYKKVLLLPRLFFLSFLFVPPNTLNNNERTNERTKRRGKGKVWNKRGDRGVCAWASDDTRALPDCCWKLFAFREGPRHAIYEYTRQNSMTLHSSFFLSILVKIIIIFLTRSVKKKQQEEKQNLMCIRAPIISCY